MKYREISSAMYNNVVWSTKTYLKLLTAKRIDAKKETRLISLSAPCLLMARCRDVHVVGPVFTYETSTWRPVNGWVLKGKRIAFISGRGPFQISHKTPYHKISQNLNGARMVFKIIQTLWHLTGVSPAKFQSDMNTFTPNLTSSTLCEISRDIETVPGSSFHFLYSHNEDCRGKIPHFVGNNNKSAHD